jgi:hypothetical protein
LRLLLFRSTAAQQRGSAAATKCAGRQRLQRLSPPHTFSIMGRVWLPWEEVRKRPDTLPPMIFSWLCVRCSILVLLLDLRFISTMLSSIWAGGRAGCC